MSPISHWIRQEIVDLKPYKPVVPLDVLAEQLGIPVEQIIKLDANENPYGPSPRALAALATEPHYALYPDPESRRLRAALSDYTGQPIERIICTSGADELLDLLTRLFLNPGDSVIDCPPTFDMYAFDTQVNGGRVVTVPRREDFSLDVPAIEQAAFETRAKIIFLATPNNPTGNQIAQADIARLLKLPLLVVVDEAYIEFTSGSVGDWVDQYPNLVVARTFSKWAGLAGLRIGYALLPETIASHLWKIKQPYNVNLAAQAAALASLEDLALLRDRIGRIVAERERLSVALLSVPDLYIYPSQANFFLCRVTGGDATRLQHALLREGILVRYYAKPQIDNCLRIGIGTPEQNNRLLEALRRLRAGPAMV